VKNVGALAVLRELCRLVEISKFVCSAHRHLSLHVHFIRNSIENNRDWVRKSKHFLVSPVTWD
jgi:hypothetical protein